MLGLGPRGDNQLLRVGLRKDVLESKKGDFGNPFKHVNSGIESITAPSGKAGEDMPFRSDRRVLIDDPSWRYGRVWMTQGVGSDREVKSICTPGLALIVGIAGTQDTCVGSSGIVDSDIFDVETPDSALVGFWNVWRNDQELPTRQAGPGRILLQWTVQHLGFRPSFASVCGSSV